MTRPGRLAQLEERFPYKRVNRSADQIAEHLEFGYAQPSCATRGRTADALLLIDTVDHRGIYTPAETDAAWTTDPEDQPRRRPGTVPATSVPSWDPPETALPQR